jgi:hypothetical protein
LTPPLSGLKKAKAYVIHTPIKSILALLSWPGLLRSSSHAIAPSIEIIYKPSYLLDAARDLVCSLRLSQSHILAADQITDKAKIINICQQPKKIGLAARA